MRRADAVVWACIFPVVHNWGKKSSCLFWEAHFMTIIVWIWLYYVAGACDSFCCRFGFALLIWFLRTRCPCCGQWACSVFNCRCSAGIAYCIWILLLLNFVMDLDRLATKTDTNLYEKDALRLVLFLFLSVLHLCTAQVCFDTISDPALDDSVLVACDEWFPNQIACMRILLVVYILLCSLLLQKLWYRY